MEGGAEEDLVTVLRDTQVLRSLLAGVKCSIKDAKKL